MRVLKTLHYRKQHFQTEYKKIYIIAGLFFFAFLGKGAGVITHIIHRRHPPMNLGLFQNSFYLVLVCHAILNYKASLTNVQIWNNFLIGICIL
jgi:hypothetical protein